MSLLNQKTIKKAVSFSGVGLHSGKIVKICIKPSEPDTGIVFKRIDLKKNNIIPANYKNVTSARLCTTLENEFGIKVSTVEHLLAALYISEIDNLIIEVNGEEIPIMDGSAKEFLDILEKTEIKILSQKRNYLKILNKIELKDGKRSISIEPSEHSFEVEFKLNYKNSIIGDQTNYVNFQSDDLKEVIESRTFCLYDDIEKIKKVGLAKGGSLENAIVVNDKEILNKGGLRNNKEFVNHKILDLSGDFFLSGFRIIGKVRCDQGGHELTNKFLRKVLKTKSFLLSADLQDPIFPKSRSDQSIKIAVNA